MFDLINGKVILCKVREIPQNEYQDQECDDDEEMSFLAINPRILNVIPTSGGKAQIILLPYLNGKEAEVRAYHIVGTSLAPRIYSDQYLQDTTGLAIASAQPAPQKLVS